ncbi:MAG: hypothetical protein RMY34_12590 [Aulosira sp. DedQUE10]|nr:hypothetical protein [Aulosira sp. DedQUE10]
MSRKNSLFYTVASLMGVTSTMALLSLPASAVSKSNDIKTSEALRTNTLYAQSGGASNSSGTEMQGYPNYGRGSQSGQNMNNNGTQGYPNSNNTGTQNGQNLNNNTNQGYPNYNNTGTQNGQNLNNTGTQSEPNYNNTGTQDNQNLNNTGTNGSSYQFCMKMHITRPPCSPPLLRGDGVSRGVNICSFTEKWYQVLTTTQAVEVLVKAFRHFGKFSVQF